MGQKTNQNILRLGKVKEWKSKYIEKKTTESSTIIFQTLEIKKFISHLFARYDLKIQNCRIYYSESSLQIYISYYNSLKSLTLSDKIKTQRTHSFTKPFKKKVKKIQQNITKKKFYATKIYKNAFNNSPKTLLFQNHYLTDKKTQRLNSLNNFKNYTDGTNYKTLNQENKNLFVSKILKSLNLFTGKKHNIFLNLRQINKETNLLQTISKENKQKIKKDLVKLRKYQKNEFFNKGFNLLYNFVQNHQEPTFLAEFTAFYFKKLKRPNFFLRFLKLALKTLINKKQSQLQRIQIKVKGRFNGAPRSSHKFINIGKNIPVLTLNSTINYGESTAYTPNGTFGIKVWTYTTIQKLLCITDQKK